MIFDTGGTPANNDYPYYQTYYTDSVDGTERSTGIDFITCPDLTESGTDGDNFDCYRGFYTVNNGTGINALATLTAAGVWTNASLLEGKDYEGPYLDYWPEGIIPKLKGLTMERYHAKNADDSSPHLERHFSPHAQEWHDAFGLGAYSPVNPPDPDNPDASPEMHIAGVSPGDMAGVALAAVLELNARVEELEASVVTLVARVAELEAE